MLKKIFCIILVISSVFSIFSCTQEPKELTEAERIEQMISDIGAITKYDEATKAKVEEAVNAYNNYINSLVYSTQSEIDNAKVDELKNLMRTQAAYNYAKSMIDVIVVDIKSRLYRPSSFELNLLTIEVYESTGNGSNSGYYFHMIIDYSAQNKMGGYEREDSMFIDSIIVYNSSNYSQELRFNDMYTTTPTPTETRDTLSEYIQGMNVEFKFAMAKSDITWTLE